MSNIINTPTQRVKIFVFHEDLELFRVVVAKCIPTMSFAKIGSISEDGEVQIVATSKRTVDFVQLGTLLSEMNNEAAKNRVPGAQRG